MVRLILKISCLKPGHKLRVFVLALDGLEFTLVKRWRLANLLQRTHGIYKAPVSPRFRKPHTPSAWTSFITGRPVEEHGIDSWWTWGRLLDKLRLLPPFAWVKGKRKLLTKLGIRPRLYGREDLRCPTLFDLIKPSVSLFVPGFSEPPEIHLMLGEAMERGVGYYVRAIWRVHRWRVAELFKRLEEEQGWRFFMVWFDLADLLGHLYMVKDRLKLMRAYVELDRLARRVGGLVDDGQTVLLIVSDHGMEPRGRTGDHSPYGFWSLNVETDWQPRRITDFYQKILEWASVGA